MKFDEIYNHFMYTKELTLAKHRFKTYNSLYDKYVLKIFGFREIDTINFLDYQKFVDNLILAGLNPKTVKNILSMISSVYTFAVKNDWYDGKDYASLVELPHYDNKFYVTFSSSIQKKYLLALKNAREPIYKDIFLFLLHGRRLSEVLDLQWEYLDLFQGIVYYPASRNKSKKYLAYELTKDLVDVLKEYQLSAIEHQGTVFITGHVFINPNTGKRFYNIRKAWKRLLSYNNLEYIKLHNIRHILTTYLLNDLKMPLDTVSFVLGHSSTEITKRHVTFKPQIAKHTIDTLFDDFKTKVDKNADKLNQAIELGECIQTALFPNQRIT